MKNRKLTSFHRKPQFYLTEFSNIKKTTLTNLEWCHVCVSFILLFSKEKKMWQIVYHPNVYENLCTSSVNNAKKEALNWLWQFSEKKKCVFAMVSSKLVSRFSVFNVYFMRTQTKCRCPQLMLVNSRQFILSAWLMCKMAGLFGKII